MTSALYTRAYTCMCIRIYLCVYIYTHTHRKSQRKICTLLIIPNHNHYYIYARCLVFYSQSPNPILTHPNPRQEGFEREGHTQCKSPPQMMYSEEPSEESPTLPLPPSQTIAGCDLTCHGEPLLSHGCSDDISTVDSVPVPFGLSFVKPLATHIL